MIMWIHTITIYTNTIKIIIYIIIIVYLLISIVKSKIVIIHFYLKYKLIASQVKPMKSNLQAIFRIIRDNSLFFVLQ